MQENSRFKKDQKEDTKNLGIQTEESESSLQRQRLQMLTMHIEEEKLEQNTRKLVKLEEQKTAMKNKDGELVETEKEVKEVYTECYKDLLSTSVASTQKNKWQKTM